jgi:hypothetical protein
VFPAYDGLELGIGDSLLVKAVCEATGRKKDAVEEDYQREGDLGMELGVLRIVLDTYQSIISATVCRHCRAVESNQPEDAVVCCQAGAHLRRPCPGYTASNYSDQGEELKCIALQRRSSFPVGLVGRQSAIAKGREDQGSNGALSGQRSQVHCPCAARQTSHWHRSSGTYVWGDIISLGCVIMANSSIVQTVLVGLAHAFTLSPTTIATTASEKLQDETFLNSIEDESVKTEMAVSLASEEHQKPSSSSRAVEVDVDALDNSQPFDELFANIVEFVPTEARKLARGVPDRSERFELSEIVVKRAFSECPNLGLIVNGLLTKPL